MIAKTKFAISIEEPRYILLNSATGYITPKDVLGGGSSGGSMRNATGGWKPPDSSAGVAASKPSEERSGPAPAMSDRRWSA